MSNEVYTYVLMTSFMSQSLAFKIFFVSIFLLVGLLLLHILFMCWLNFF